MKKNSARISRTFLLILSLLYEVTLSQAQLRFQYINDIAVSQNGEVLSIPFAGGLNSGQYNTVDLDNDGDLDLVVFDRTSDKINTFINTGSGYNYQPEFEHFFPNDLENWIVFADYDCDGKKDIFTHTNFGMRVFRNTSSGNFPSWEIAEDPLFTQGTSSRINLFLNTTDIPGIADIDGDEDLDIFVFNFATGALIEFHQNFSVERTGNCGALDFERVSRSFGDIEECTCNVFTFNGDPCPIGGRQLHAGGKATTLFDYDNDGDMDLVIGQEICEDIYLIENKGTVGAPSFDSFTNLFPEAGLPVNMFTFPTAFIEDMNFDGLKDFIVAPNLRGNPGNGIDYQNSSWLYTNTGSSTNNSYSLSKRNFLQGEMIDMGEFAYPSFADVDGDGDEDLIVGNGGLNFSDGFYATLHFYRKDPTGFNLVDTDFAGLSTLQFTDIKPNFQDLDGDGKLDLIFTGRGTGDFELHYILNTSSSTSFEFNATNTTTLPTILGGSDDPVLVDIDQDNVLDLLIGRSTGRLTYLNNSGTNISPVFEVIDEMFLGLDFSSTNSNLSLTVGDVNFDGLNDLITTDRSGVLKIYSDFVNNQGQSPQSNLLNIDDANDLRSTNFGRVSRPAVGQINNTKTIAVGSIQGGIRLIGTEGGTSEGDDLVVKVFPVPSKLDKVINLETSNANVQFEIFGISGERIMELTTLDQFAPQRINLSSLKTGLYFARFQNAVQTKTVKFVLGDG